MSEGLFLLKLQWSAKHDFCLTGGVRVRCKRFTLTTVTNESILFVV